MVRGGHRADDHRLPRACRVEEHVVRGEEAVFLQRPSRHPRLSSARASTRGFRHIDRRSCGCARGHAHDHRAVVPLLEQVDGGEVEVELRHLRIGQVPDHRVDHLVPRGPRLEHGGRHVAQRAEQPVAVLELADQPLGGERSTDELRARPQHFVGRRGAAHGREGVPAE